MLRKGQTVPEFHLNGAGGGRFSARELTAKGPLVLFFIRSTTCTFCQGELARLASRYKEFEAAGLAVAAVVGGGFSWSGGWYNYVRPPYPLLVDEDRAVARHFGVYKALGFDSFRMAQPSAFVVDQSGVIQFAHLVTEEDAARTLDDCLTVGRSLVRAPARATLGNSA